MTTCRKAISIHLIGPRCGVLQKHRPGRRGVGGERQEFPMGFFYALMVKRWQNLVDILWNIGIFCLEDLWRYGSGWWKSIQIFHVRLVHLYPHVMKPLKSCKNCCVLQFERKCRWINTGCVEPRTTNFGKVACTEVHASQIMYHLDCSQIVPACLPVMYWFICIHILYILLLYLCTYNIYIYIFYTHIYIYIIYKPFTSTPYIWEWRGAARAIAADRLLTHQINWWGGSLAMDRPAHGGEICRSAPKRKRRRRMPLAGWFFNQKNPLGVWRGNYLPWGCVFLVT